LFRQIVILDRSRIRSRLRFRHATVWRQKRTRDKPAILQLLNKTVNYPPVDPREKTARARIARARLQCAQLLRTFEIFESVSDDDPSIRRSNDVLVDLLIQISELEMASVALALLISPTRNHELRTVLPQTLAKLGRYYTIACDLINAARGSQCVLFKRISIKPLQEPATNLAPNSRGLASNDEVLGRFADDTYCYQDGDPLAARTKYHSRISALPSLRKVHAEIQLLFFYEQNPDLLRPRSLCSSKSACYVCNLFIKAHGLYHVPRTHGRLYDRWVLPEYAAEGALNAEHMSSTIRRPQ